MDFRVLVLCIIPGDACRQHQASCLKSGIPAGL